MCAIRLMIAAKYVIVICHLVRPPKPPFFATATSYVHRPGSVYYTSKHSDEAIHTLAWAVQLRSVDVRESASLAQSIGLVSQGLVGALSHHFLLVHPLYLAQNDENSFDASVYFKIKEEVESKLRSLPEVVWFSQEVMRSRVKRSVTDFPIVDPYYPQQWHLHNTHSSGMDLNVTGLWRRNITGKGITVCVIDDGLEWSNPDLIANYSPEGSWDLNDDDSDPMPSLDGMNNHGTRCAGEIAAARNSVCGVGVAFEARIAGLKILDGKMTDSLEATAFNKNLKVNDIYSCSWGPEDDGKTVDGPRYMSNLAIEHGINNGRNGYGTIYVVASGNGGLNGDDCNYDGYANSIYTVTIGAVDEFGKVPFYAEKCACMLAVTFSSGGQEDRSIVTTDWLPSNEKGCTTDHTGTSAAAPLAAAMIALALQVRPCLTWRDLQYLIVLTALPIDSKNRDWHENAAGLFHSHRHGFGLLTAWRLVAAVTSWRPLPWMTTYSSQMLEVENIVPPFPRVLNLTHTVSESMLQNYYLYVLEYVRVRITVRHPCRGRLEFKLSCPSGSESILAKPREKDNSSLGLDQWTFATVRCWGERPVGLYALVITDRGLDDSRSLGTFVRWQLIIHGAPMKFEEFQQRKRLALEAVNGWTPETDDNVLPCPPPPVPFFDVVEFRMSDKLLKILIVTGVFLFFLAVFETFEYLLCYDEEKRRFYDATGDDQPPSDRSPDEVRLNVVEPEILIQEVAGHDVNAVVVLQDGADDIEDGEAETSECKLLLSSST